MKRRTPRIGTLLFGVVAGMSPITVTESGRLAVAEACADGTCCPETGSDCFINGVLTENAYKATKPGPCSQQT